MRKQAFQHAELRDENDNIIQEGAYGKESALANSQNDGFIDYVMNNLEALNDNQTDGDSALSDHIANTDNPHKVTASQLGLATAYKYKGSLASYGDLPTDAEVGDVYNVAKADTEHGIDAGDNVAWTGTDWDVLAGNVDLSDYALTASVDSKISGLRQDVNDGTTPAGALTETMLAQIKELIAVAKQEAKEEALQANYPVGAPYVSFTDPRNPAEILGFGTWEALDAGHTLVAAGTATENGTTYNFEAGSTGGEFAHQLTVGEMPSHTHKLTRQQWYTNDTGDTSVVSIYSWRDVYTGTAPAYNAINPTRDIKNTGGSNRHNNLPPYASVYLWHRTA